MTAADAESTNRFFEENREDFQAMARALSIVNQRCMRSYVNNNPPGSKDSRGEWTADFIHVVWCTALLEISLTPALRDMLMILLEKGKAHGRDLRG